MRTRSSHYIYRHPDTGQTITVVSHGQKGFRNRIRRKQVQEDIARRELGDEEIARRVNEKLAQ